MNIPLVRVPALVHVISMHYFNDSIVDSRDGLIHYSITHHFMIVNEFFRGQ